MLILRSLGVCAQTVHNGSCWEQGFVQFADTQRARRQVFKVELRSTDYTSLVKKKQKNPPFLLPVFTVWGQGTEREKGKRDEGWDVRESSNQFLGCESRRFIGDSPLRLRVHKLMLALLYAALSNIFPERLSPFCVEPSAGF